MTYTVKTLNNETLYIEKLYMTLILHNNSWFTIQLISEFILYSVLVTPNNELIFYVSKYNLRVLSTYRNINFKSKSA